MQKNILYGIIAAVVAAAGAGAAFAAVSMNNNTPNADSFASPSDNTRVIKHLGGETEITGTPKRIVVLDSELAENVLLLGAGDSIVGASLWETFDSSFEEEMGKVGLSVPSHIVDVGDYWQPNLESIAELEPDLIIISDVWSKLIYDDLNEIAPTLMFATYPSEDAGAHTLEEMEQTFMTLADALDRHEEGTAALDRFHAKLDEATTWIESAGLKGQKFAVAEVWVSEDKPEMYLYTKNSIASQTLEKVGLQNAVPDDQDAQWGLITAEPEGLASIAIDNPAMHFFFGYYDTVDEVNYHDTRNIVRNGPVWENMEFNKRNQAHELGAEFKPRPTPRHMEAMLDKVVEALTSDDGTRTISHAMGETEIQGTPERIVALDWSSSEILLTMGIQPVAVADLESMKNLLRPEGLSPDIADIGTMQEPSLEAIAELEPDLILAETFNQSGLYDELSSIAPTVMYSNSPPLEGTPTHLEALEQNIILVADAVNKRDKGDEILDRLHSKYEEAAAKIEAAGMKGTKYVVGAVDPPYGEYATSTVRFFDNTFFMSQMLSRMGLENAVTEEYGLSEWGMKVVGLEGLAAVDGKDVHFFYIHAEGQDAFRDEWKDNPVWTNLEMAKEGNNHPLGTLYVYGGPEQMEEMIDKVVEALT